MQDVSAYGISSSQPSQSREHPQILINSTIVPLEEQPRILDVTHDTMYTFAAHCRNQAVKVRARNNILKAFNRYNMGTAEGDHYSHISSYRQICDRLCHTNLGTSN